MSDWLEFIILFILLIVVMPGLKTDFSGASVWWEPWFLDFFKKNRKTEESKDGS